MRWAMRIFGGSNVVASLFGLYYFAWGIQIHLGKWPGNPNRQEWIVFLAISALSTSLVLYLAYLGVRLINRDFKVLRQVCFVFVSEIAICFVDFIVTCIRPRFEKVWSGSGESPFSLLNLKCISATPSLG